MLKDYFPEQRDCMINRNCDYNKIGIYIALSRSTSERKLYFQPYFCISINNYVQAFAVTWIVTTYCYNHQYTAANIVS